MRNRLSVTRGHSRAKREGAANLRHSMAPAESRLWQKFKSNRLNGLHFRRQQVAAGFILDFYCHSCSLVVEVDGDGHTYRRHYDSGRDQILAHLGMKVLRFSHDQIRGDLGEVTKEIWRAAQADLPRPAARTADSPRSGHPSPWGGAIGKGDRNG